MDPSETQRKINEIDWYHDIDFPNGLKARTKIPPVDSRRALWAWIRSQLDKIDFSGKSVLDIGCWDGYWSFYAKQRGAAGVLASDDKTQNHWGHAGLELARDLMGSTIDTRTDLSIYDLSKLEKRFDIILCLGVYYHLVDPFYAFSQVRHCCHEQSLVIFEGDFAPAWFVKPEQSAYYDLGHESRCFVPTITCLRQMLEANYFRVSTESFYETLSPDPANRALVTCEPVHHKNARHLNRPPFGLHIYDPRWWPPETAEELLRARRPSRY